MLKKSQGAKANESGKILENTIIPALEKKGFIVVNYKDWYTNLNLFGEELLIKDVPFNTIYGHQGKTEFVLSSASRNLRIRIECKWQQVKGSVDAYISPLKLLSTFVYNNL